MNDPREAMKQLADQMGWLSQMMGGEFWGQLQEGLEAARPSAVRPGAPAGARPGAPLRGQQAFPPLDIYVTDAEVVISAALPGVAPEAVAVSLTTPGEVVLEAFMPPEAIGTPLMRERPAGYCIRTVTLPAPVRADGCLARSADGIIELRLQRSEPGTGTAGVALLQVSPGEG